MCSCQPQPKTFLGSSSCFVDCIWVEQVLFQNLIARFSDEWKIIWCAQPIFITRIAWRFGPSVTNVKLKARWNSVKTSLATTAVCKNAFTWQITFIWFVWDVETTNRLLFVIVCSISCWCFITQLRQYKHMSYGVRTQPSPWIVTLFLRTWCTMNPTGGMKTATSATADCFLSFEVNMWRLWGWSHTSEYSDYAQARAQTRARLANWLCSLRRGPPLACNPTNSWRAIWWVLIFLVV